MLHKGFIWVLLILATLLSLPVLADDELEIKLREVDKLRNGFSTPFDEVEKRCNELLQKYSSPKDQGRIYYMLAHVEGQSGLQRPQKALNYIEKALELTQDKLKRAQLYMYQGNTIEVMNRGVRGKALMAPRELATESYLKSIQECCERISELKAIKDLPPESIDSPKVDPKTGLLSPGPNNRLLTQAKYAKDMRDREIENLMGFNDAFVEQTSYLYSRFPFDTENLEKLATETFKDKAILEKLMTRVRSRVQERADKLQNEVLDNQLTELYNAPAESMNDPKLPKQTQGNSSVEKDEFKKDELGNSSQEILLSEAKDDGLSTFAIICFIILGSVVLIAIIIWLRKTNNSK